MTERHDQISLRKRALNAGFNPATANSRRAAGWPENRWLEPVGRRYHWGDAAVDAIRDIYSDGADMHELLDLHKGLSRSLLNKFLFGNYNHHCRSSVTNANPQATWRCPRDESIVER